jgi:hypothetical protein
VGRSTVSAGKQRRIAATAAVSLLVPIVCSAGLASCGDEFRSGNDGPDASTDASGGASTGGTRNSGGAEAGGRGQTGGTVSGTGGAAGGTTATGDAATAPDAGTPDGSVDGGDASVPCACDNPDPDHCDATCTGTKCVVTARDGDHDGHGTLLCKAAPGDDCDDEAKATYPGAPELCDGSDNDCSGAADEDLPLAGEPVQLISVASSASLGLVARADGYALLSLSRTSIYDFGNPDQVMLLSASGDLTKNVNVAALVDMVDPVIVSAGTDLYIGARRTQPTIPLDALRLDGNLAQLGDTTPPSWSETAGVSDRAMTTTADGRAVFVWTENSGQAPAPGGVRAHVIGADGSLTETTRIAEVNVANALLASPTATRGKNGFAIGWVENDAIANQSARTLEVHLALTGTSLKGVSVNSVIDTLQITDTETYLQAERPRIQLVADGNDYVAGWLDLTGAVKIARYDSEGTRLCGPVKLPGTKTWGVANTFASTPLGVLAVASSTTGQAMLFRVDTACQVSAGQVLNDARSRVALSTNFETNSPRLSVGDPVIAAGADGKVMIAWVERDKTAGENGGTAPAPPIAPRVMRRRLGNLLCNE